MANKAKQLKVRKRAARRRAKRANIVGTMKFMLTRKLRELAAGKTYSEKLRAHCNFYDTCNPAEQMFLRLLFKRMENKDLIDGALA